MDYSKHSTYKDNEEHLQTNVGANIFRKYTTHECDPNSNL